MYVQQQYVSGIPIIIPDKLAEELKWKPYKTILDITIEGDSIKVQRKTEWTIEEIQKKNFFELVIEDVTTTGTPHYIVHDGHRYVIAPYSEELYGNVEESFLRKNTQNCVDENKE